MNDWPGDHFSEIAGWFGIIGFGVSGWSLRLVYLLNDSANQERRRREKKELFPKLLKRLTDDCARLELWDTYHDHNSKASIRYIGDVEGNLNTIAGYMEDNAKKSVKSVQTKMRSYKRNRTNVSLSEFLGEAQRFNSELDYMIQKMQING